MWYFSDSAMTFNNPAYTFDGGGPGSGGGGGGTIGPGTGESGGRVILNGKKQGETITYEFDFISQLAVGETLTSATVVSQVYAGVDPAPGAMVTGAATIRGTLVDQGITGGVSGVTYALTCIGITSRNQTIELNGFIVIDEDLI